MDHKRWIVKKQVLQLVIRILNKVQLSLPKKMSAMLDFLKIILDCCVTLQQHLMTLKPKLERENAC